MPVGVYPRTAEHRKNIGLSLKGKKYHQKLPRSAEHCRKISEFLTGRKLTDEHRENLRLSHAGKKFGNYKTRSSEHARKISEGLKGKKQSVETRLKRSESLKKIRPRTVDRTKKDEIRRSIELRLWREAVFSRDNWTCQKCEKRGVRLEAHHILGFSEYPELRTAIANGKTLCKKCHLDHHKGQRLSADRFRMPYIL